MAAVRPAPAAAADGDPLLLGESNLANTPTSHTGDFSVGGTLEGADLDSGGVGVRGIGQYRGVYAYATNGWALFAEASPGAALTLEAQNSASGGGAIAGNASGDGASVGVHGTALNGSGEPNQAGVWGEGRKSGVQGNALYGGVGVAGAVHQNGSYGVPRIGNRPPSAGVYGVNGLGGTSDAGVAGWVADGNGVIGTTASGTGVFGFAGSGGSTWPAAKVSVGVYGASTSSLTSSRGVWGHAAAGTGVYCTSSGGTALHVVGKSKFSRAGKATMAAGRSYVDVTVPGGIAANTIVIATLHTYRPGVAVSSVRLNYPTAGKARIYLTKVPSTSSSTSIGWIAAEYGA